MTKEAAKIVDLLWTGGWDSTFRLLQLVFSEKKVVQPHYVIRQQECTGTEIDTMNRILRKISREYGQYEDQILPVQFFNMNAINANEKLKHEYRELSKKAKVNKQYEILAQYCHQIGVTSMELCVLSNEMFGSFKTGNNLFRYFQFPLLNVTKTDMREIAVANNWLEIMNMTWFCRRPIKGQPCGFCGPCTDVVIAGMSHRLPIKARMKARLQLPFRQWWRNNYQRQGQGWFQKTFELLKRKV
ncbi:MAG: hypothetical protein GVY07_05420 [Bacteroidetes bacterium]|jgi:7-cyano-7-deazaguanine synthase in queuosine biosynthesis|nr:hypothetical protein [Bacteroidota bacterium]